MQANKQINIQKNNKVLKKVVDIESGESTSPSWVAVVTTRSFLVHSDQFKLPLRPVCKSVLGMPLKVFKLKCRCFWEVASFHGRC